MSEPDEIQKLLKSVRSRLRTLIVVTMLLALAVLLCVVAVFGYLVEYHAGEALLRGGAIGGVAVLAFFFGWLAGRRA
jgi:hypothetical protein